MKYKCMDTECSFASNCKHGHLHDVSNGCFNNCGVNKNGKCVQVDEEKDNAKRISRGIRLRQ
jgi:hypothetical protein